MISTFTLVIAIIAIALIFDFLNGFNDSANSIATIVITKTLTPIQALLMAGLANFIGYFTFGTAIAKMVGKGVVYPDFISLQLLLAALLGAALWTLVTSLYGLPISCSHALIGGLVGSAIAAGGLDAIVYSGLFSILLFIVVAPLLGMLGSIVFTIVIMNLFKKSNPVKSKKIFKYLQLVSALFYSMSHGTNDAQKTMGIIALALVAGGIKQEFMIDNWVALSCYSAIGIGTMLGGWQVIKTMGTKITKITAMEGFCAETASAIVLMGTAQFGIPVSTTHVIAGSIMGVGTVQGAASVKWVTARKILWAWVLTIPLTGLCSAITYYLVSPFMP